MLNLSTAQSEQSLPQIYKFNDSQIQVVLKDAEPWFVASDVADVLGYRNAHDAVRMLDDDEKGTHNLRTLGGRQDVTIVSESGLYALVLKSRRKEAKPFRRWVTHEVLPSIRRTGSYSVPNATISPAQQLAIRKAVADKAKKHSAAFGIIYAAIYEQFRIASYKDLPASKFDLALKFIESLKMNLPALPEKNVHQNLSENDWKALQNFVYYYGYFFRKEFLLIEELLYKVQSPIASKFHDAIHEISLLRLESILERNGYAIKTMPQFKALTFH